MSIEGDIIDLVVRLRSIRTPGEAAREVPAIARASAGSGSGSAVDARAGGATRPPMRRATGCTDRSGNPRP